MVRKNHKNDGQTRSWCLDKAVLAKGGGGTNNTACLPEIAHVHTSRSSSSQLNMNKSYNFGTRAPGLCCSEKKTKTLT